MLLFFLLPALVTCWRICKVSTSAGDYEVKGNTLRYNGTLLKVENGAVLFTAGNLPDSLSIHRSEKTLTVYRDLNVDIKIKAGDLVEIKWKSGKSIRFQVERKKMQLPNLITQTRVFLMATSWILLMCFFLSFVYYAFKATTVRELTIPQIETFYRITVLKSEYDCHGTWLVVEEPSVLGIGARARIPVSHLGREFCFREVAYVLLDEIRRYGISPTFPDTVYLERVDNMWNENN